MELKSYCDSMATELMGWKVRVYDTVRKLDKVPSGDKEKVIDEVRELHMLIEEIDDRINRLRTQCPTEWSPEQRELEGKLTQVKDLWQKSEESLSTAAQTA